MPVKMGKERTMRLACSLEHVLDECLSQLDTGEFGLEEVLARYPEREAELRPLLQTAMMVRQALRATPSPEATAVGRQRLLATVARKVKKERAMCHDCGAMEGELHQFGCDMESCPYCGSQLISCGCCYDKLGLRNDRLYTKNTDFIQPEVYEHGLSEEQGRRWLEILEEKGRIPWIQYPNICIKCGALWPEMFAVPNEEWEKYVEPAMRGKMLCWECYEWIQEMIDGCAGMGR